MSGDRRSATTADKLAAEIDRYLAVVEVFAALGADPNAEARARAARARPREQANYASAAQPAQARRRLFR